MTQNDAAGSNSNIEPPSPKREQPGRRASALALPPLALIAAAFFLPSIKACSEVESPATYLVDAPSAMLWVVPPYLVAALLFGLTIFALIRRAEPTRWQNRTALAGLAACCVAVVYPLVAYLVEWTDDRLTEGAFAPEAFHLDLDIDAAWIAWLFVAGSAAAILIAAAMRRRGWRRWTYFIATYTVLASPICVWFLWALFQGDLYEGGYVYLGSIAALGAVSVYALLRARPAGDRTRPPTEDESPVPS